MEENTQEEVQAVPARKKLIKNFVKVTLDRPGYNKSGIDSLKVGTLRTVDTESLKSIISNLADKTYTPVAKDKLYFYPECTVPRFKVREMWKPKKVSITIKEEYGTHKFLSSNYDKYIEGGQYYYKASNKDFKEWLQTNRSIFQAYLDSMLLENLDQTLQNHLKDDTGYIFMDYSLNYCISGSYSNMNGKDAQGNDYTFPIASLPKYTIESERKSVFKDANIAEAWEEALNNPTDFYLDDAINKALQDESTIIDGEMYEQLKNLLESSDEANTTMAMEVIANSNIEQSAKYIYKLMRHYSGNMCYNKCYNSVNFRALRESTGLDRYTRYDDDSYIKFLQKYDQADMDLVDTIRRTCQTDAIESIKRLYQNSVNSGILEIEIPYIKVTLKGVNDGTQVRKIVDPQLEQTLADVEANKEKYEEVLKEVIAPCAAHDEATVEAEELDAEDREMLEMNMSEEELEAKQMAEDYLNEVTDGEYSEDEVADEGAVEGTIEVPKSIVAPVIEAITPEPVDHDDDDHDNIFAEGEYVDDPFSDNLVEADDEDLIS